MVILIFAGRWTDRSFGAADIAGTNMRRGYDSEPTPPFVEVSTVQGGGVVNPPNPEWHAGILGAVPRARRK